MAIMIRHTCYKCQKTKSTTVGSGQSIPNLCMDCQIEEKDVERLAYFNSLDELTLEERVRRIEEWIYNYRPTHVPAPTF